MSPNTGTPSLEQSPSYDRPKNWTDLPIHLVEMILCEYHTLQDLCHLISTCKHFHDVFTNKRDSFLGAVIKNHVGHDVLPEALRVWDSRCPQLRRETGQELLATPMQASEIKRLDDIVRKLADMFTNDCFGGDPPSRRESARVRRSLYRFELLIRTFLGRNYDIMDDEARSRSVNFMAQYWYHEIMQLHALNYFFYHLLSDRFNDLALHDIAWGFHGVWSVAPPPSSSFHPYFQHLLLRGLEHIYHSATTKTYEERSRAFGDVMQLRVQLLFCLGHALKYAVFDPHRDKPEFAFEDGDNGPATLVNVIHHQPWKLPLLHRSGAVMWDKMRIIETGLFQWHWPKRIKNPVMAPVQPLDLHLEVYYRSDLYRRGYRGRLVIIGFPFVSCPVQSDIFPRYLNRHFPANWL